MANEHRGPSVIIWLGILLLVVSIAGPTWYFTRPAPPPVSTGPALEDLDVVCNGRVDIDGSTFSLDPNVPGRVVELHVKESAVVKKGDAILKLDDSSYLGAVKEAKAAVKAVQVEIEAAQVRLKQHPDQIALQQKKIEAADAEVGAAEKQLEQMQERAKVTSQITKADVEAFAAKIKSGKLLADAERLQLEQLRKIDPELELKALQAKKEAADVTVERAEKAVLDCVLKAPSDGTILRLQTAVGATLSPGLPLPTILFAPSSQLIIRADVEQSSLGRVKEGMKAAVRDDARSDSPTWNGRVRTIAGWVAQKRSILLEPGELNDVRTTEVVIELDGSPSNLRIGQRMLIRITK
ncbi:HlyD family secretion protein [Limnoglobus roseus]|uniref:Secretion protein HlyD family protein n=1 Tax=Limnoglobus roseus TaxID=2598579 RepID=A0A5C1AJU3_9BACT|nr:efflux RND transporter periplasmic adaptor subunit [Limnoglobus roseus]QEL18447.1 secretion protein HlyD family protein [Limnoglobus roseus]